MLTVAEIRNRVATELQAALGFELEKRPRLKLTKRINPETEVFFYPGASKKRGELRLDPVIGVENLVLRERLRSNGWKGGGTAVCHAYLGMLDSWGHLVVHSEAELDKVATRVVRSVKEVGLPIMMNFDSLDKVVELYEDTLAHHVNKWQVAVLFAKEKLAVLRTN
jgi:hypothetical protein